MFVKTGELCRLLDLPSRSKIWASIKKGRLRPPPKDSAGFYTWRKSDIQRAREILCQDLRQFTYSGGGPPRGGTSTALDGLIDSIEFAGDEVAALVRELYQHPELPAPVRDNAALVIDEAAGSLKALAIELRQAAAPSRKVAA